MFSFLKRLLGFPTEVEVLSAKRNVSDTPVIINNKTGDVVDAVSVQEEVKVSEVVTSQITDAVTQTPVKEKKARKPREPKVAKEKAPRGRKPGVKKSK